MSTKTPRFYYIRTDEKDRVITLAYIFSEDFKSATVGWAICNKTSGDQFVKKEGRERALARLDTAPVQVIFAQDSTTWFARMADIVRGLQLGADKHPRIQKFSRLSMGTWHKLNNSHIQKVWDRGDTSVQYVA